jgi:hypothetical protein
MRTLSNTGIEKKLLFLTIDYRRYNTESKSNPPQSPLVRGEALKSPLSSTLWGINGDLEGFDADW